MTVKTYEVTVPEENLGWRKRRCGYCAFFRFFLTVIAILSISVLAAFYAFNFIGAPLRAVPGCPEPVVDPYGSSDWTPGATTVTFRCNQGVDMEGCPSGTCTSECINKQWVPAAPACVTLPIRLDCQVNQNGLQGTISMWQESTRSPTYVFGFLNMSHVPKVLTSLSEVITLSSAKCHRSVLTNVTMPPPTPLAQLHQEVEIRFETQRIAAYKEVELHLTVVFVDIPKSLTRSVASLHQGDETVIMDTPPGWPFGDHSKAKDSEMAIHSHGRTAFKKLEPAHQTEPHRAQAETKTEKVEKVGDEKKVIEQFPKVIKEQGVNNTAAETPVPTATEVKALEEMPAPATDVMAVPETVQPDDAEKLRQLEAAATEPTPAKIAETLTEKVHEKAAETTQEPANTPAVPATQTLDKVNDAVNAAKNDESAKVQENKPDTEPAAAQPDAKIAGETPPETNQVVSAPETALAIVPQEPETKNDEAKVTPVKTVTPEVKSENDAENKGQNETVKADEPVKVTGESPAETKEVEKALEKVDQDPKKLEEDKAATTQNPSITLPAEAQEKAKASLEKVDQVVSPPSIASEGAQNNEKNAEGKDAEAASNEKVAEKADLKEKAMETARKQTDPINVNGKSTDDTGKVPETLEHPGIPPALYEDNMPPAEAAPVETQVPPPTETQAPPPTETQTPSPKDDETKTVKSETETEATPKTDSKTETDPPKPETDSLKPETEPPKTDNDPPKTDTETGPGEKPTEKAPGSEKETSEKDKGKEKEETHDHVGLIRAVLNTLWSLFHS